MRHVPLFKVFMASSASTEVAKVLNSGFIGQGPKVEEFESSLRSYFDFDYVLTLNAGTSVLHLALHMLKQKAFGWPGMEPGDEVLATPLTCTASNWPILANNFKIKWVDIDPKTMNMDLGDLARKMSSKTKAIMLVHWGGYPNDLDKLKIIQEKYKEIHGFKPAIIEDCAHAFGSKFNGKLVGTHGNISMFSLQAIKHVTSLDGGILLAPHKELYSRGKLMRWYGIDRNSDRKDFRCEANIDEWGFKFHMNDICATVGMENLKYSGQVIETHKSNAAYYDHNLKNTPGITLLDRDPRMDSSFWIYSLLVDNRYDFQRKMKEYGIQCSQVHERNDKHTCVSEFKSILPSLDSVIGKLSAIPVGWWVSEEDREYIVDCIKKGW
jgi:dTDP-4-amino-4,6-dideoxygalactose transaminase